MINQSSGSFQVATILATKRMRGRARREMIGKGVEHSLIKLTDSNFSNRCPFSQVCCTTKEQPCRPASVSSGLEPVGKRVHVLASCALTQLTQGEHALKIKLQHDNLHGS